jgi:hypothetical protein
MTWTIIWAPVMVCPASGCGGGRIETLTVSFIVVEG